MEGTPGSCVGSREIGESLLCPTLGHHENLYALEVYWLFLPVISIIWGDCLEFFECDIFLCGTGGG